MFYVVRPTVAPVAAPVYDPEEAYIEAKRLEYIAALEQKRKRHEYEEALAIEEERHRTAIQAINEREALRRQYARRRVDALRPQPSIEDIRRVRQHQREEARRSHEIQQRLVNEIFGAAFQQAASAERSEQPKHSTSRKPAVAKSAEGEADAHWSNAPERAKSLAEISSINRTFTALKNTFVFPSGPLDRIEGSDTPRLAYTATNASIHAYEHALSELLTKLDAVESFGFKGVREARKQLVVKVEKELEELEKAVSERLAVSPSPAPVRVRVVVEDASEEKDDVIMSAPAPEAPKDVTVGYDVGEDDAYVDAEPLIAPLNPPEEVAKTDAQDPIEVDQQAHHETEPTSAANVEVPSLGQEAQPTPLNDAPINTATDTSVVTDTAPAEHHSDSEMDSEIEDAVRIVVSPEDHEADKDEYEML